MRKRREVLKYFNYRIKKQNGTQIKKKPNWLSTKHFYSIYSGLHWARLLTWNKRVKKDNSWKKPQSIDMYGKKHTWTKTRYRVKSFSAIQRSAFLVIWFAFLSSWCSTCRARKKKILPLFFSFNLEGIF